MTPSTITHVWCGDWSGIYVDGALKTEGHSHSVWHVCDALKGHLVGEYTEIGLKDSWVERWGLPPSLREIPVKARL